LFIMLTKYLCMFFLGLMLLVISNLQAATIHVPDNYKTIQEAVKNASPRDTIIVHEGYYTENIIITKPLTIESTKGSDASIIHAAVQNEPVLKINNVNEVSISGFTVTGSQSAGIYLYNSHNGQLRGNKVVNNGSGIVLISSNNNTFVNNTANLNEQYGIYLELSNNNILEKNIVNSNKDKGIFLSSSSYNELINNNVNLNAWNGITLWSSHNNLLKDNNILRNRYGIVLSDSNNNILTNNSTWSNIYAILPIVLIYIGILLYLVQKHLLRFI